MQVEPSAPLKAYGTEGYASILMIVGIIDGRVLPLQTHLFHESQSI